jgi:hypothetical protein
MPDQKPLSSSQKLGYALLALGGIGRIIVAVYFSIVSSALPTSAVVLTGDSIAPRGLPLALLSRFRLHQADNPAKAQPRPDATVTPSAEATASGSTL